MGLPIFRRLPRDRGERRKIGKRIRHPQDIESAEVQWKPQQRAKIKIRPKARHKNRENLPEKKNTPEKQCHPLQAALGKKSVCAGIEGKTQSDNQDAAEDTRKDQANQVEAVIFLEQAVPQY